jgi:hypothetical protein
LNLERLLFAMKSTRVTFELTSGKPISGEVTFLGSDFVALSINAERVVSEIVPFSSIASVHAVSDELLHTKR